MPAVRFCCPAFAGANLYDPKTDSEAPRPVGSVESIDTDINASTKTLETEQGGRTSFEALNAEPIPAIDLATEPDEAAEVAVLHNFIQN